MNFFSNPEVAALAGDIETSARSGKYTLSDLILEKDGMLLQFADLVMEGGGTLGVALVGYIHGLEQAGVRFLNIGGSSVGAIVALLLSCMGDRSEPKGEKLAAVVSGMDMGSLVDGKFFPARLSKLIGSGEPGRHIPSIVFCALLSLCELWRHLGINPGDKLLSWIASQLASFGVSTLDDAGAIIAAMPDGVFNRQTSAPLKNYTPTLKLVAADITTSTKVVFPAMAPMYWPQPGAVNPAVFARASASIPGFFRPCTVKGVSSIIAAGDTWDKLCSFKGPLPDVITFADGGLLSNFPIDLFHVPAVPRAPTFGARLGSSARKVKEISSLSGYAAGLFGALRHYADYDFIYRNPLYRQLIAYIPTEKFNWLDFNMTDETKLSLFLEGLRAARMFLETFDWEEHKRLRAMELDAMSPERRCRMSTVSL